MAEEKKEEEEEEGEGEGEGEKREARQGRAEWEKRIELGARFGFDYIARPAGRLVRASLPVVSALRR